MKYSILINGEEVATAVASIAPLFAQTLIDRIQDDDLSITLKRIKEEEPVAKTEEAATITEVDEI